MILIDLKKEIGGSIYIKFYHLKKVSLLDRNKEYNFQKINIKKKDLECKIRNKKKKQYIKNIVSRKL